MTDYYELFKGEVEKTCGEYAAKVRDLKQQVVRIGKRLADEQNNGGRLQTRIDALKAKAGGDSLTGSKNSYEKFRASLTKLGRDLETSSALQTALGELLDKKTKELAHTEDNLVIMLRNCLVSHRPVADERIEDLLGVVIAEYDSFLGAWQRLFADYGHTFYCSSESYCPGVSSAREVEELRSSLDVSARRRASRKAAEAPKVAEPQQASEPSESGKAPVEPAQQDAPGPPQSVQDEQSPLEPAQDAPLVAPCMTDGASVCLRDPITGVT